MNPYLQRRSNRKSLRRRWRRLFIVSVASGLAWLPRSKAAAGDHEVRPSAMPQAFEQLTIHAAPKPLPIGAVTENWPRFLGPTHNAISRETKLLQTWPTTGPDVVWEMQTGEGFATPTILNGRLIFFHRVGDKETVECLDPETGKRFWQFSYPSDYRDRYGFNNGPRSAPVLDDGRAYVLGVQGKLHCLDLATGTIVWKRDIAAEFNVPQDYFGFVTTPLVEGDLLIVNVGAPKGPCVVGFDKRTGKVVWKAGDQWGPSCASPIPGVVHGKRRVFVFAGGDSRPPTGGLLCIDPANGKIDFRLPFRSKSYASVNASSPVIAGNQVFISSSYKTGGSLLDVLSDGSHKVVWRTDGLRSHFMTPILKDGFLYGFDGMNRNDMGLSCVDFKTGARRWREQPDFPEPVKVNGEEKTVHYSTDQGSLLYVDGRFLCLGQQGHLLWLDLSPEGYKELARTRLFCADETWGVPALSRGLLFVTQNKRDTRTGTPPRLICYDLRAAG